MRRLLVILILLCLPEMAGSVIKVAHLRISRSGHRVNIRITARNPDTRWRGPLRIELYAKARLGPWLHLKTWTKVPALGPGHKVCRDFFDDNSLILKAMGATGTFQVKAIITAPGLKCIEERASFL